ncbi:unnamed protein product [Sympodiomycopsis kandeliae]
MASTEDQHDSSGSHQSDEPHHQDSLSSPQQVPSVSGSDEAQPSNHDEHADGVNFNKDEAVSHPVADGPAAELNGKHNEAPEEEDEQSSAESAKPRLSAGLSILPQIHVSDTDHVEVQQSEDHQSIEHETITEPPSTNDTQISEASQMDSQPEVATAEDVITPQPAEKDDPLPPVPQIQTQDTVSTRSSRPSSISSSSSGASLRGSSVFILSALENLLASKDAKGSKSGPKELRSAAESARDLVKAVSGNPQAEFDPRAVFEPFRLACDSSKSASTQTTALDCIGKMVSYGFFTTEHDSFGMAELVINTICNLPPNSPSAVTLQQLKALLAIVLAGLARQSSLLQAVKTAYDVFLLAKDPQTQAVAQGVLTQMCSATFARIKVGSRKQPHEQGEESHESEQSQDLEGDSQLESKDSQQDEPSRSPADATATQAQGETAVEEGSEAQRVTLKEMESRASFDQAAPGITFESNGRGTASSTKVDRIPNGNSSANGAGDGNQNARGLTEDEVLTKDAFLVLRALCKLAMKTVGPESERDLRSHGMRSKLLSLHLILGILKSHLHVFNDPSISLSSSTTGERTPLVQAVKQYLCLSLSRNAVSPVNQVFEVSCEVFWVVLSGLRTKLKKEIEVLLNEIFLPILEMRTSTTRQKSILLNILMRVCRDPQALVEIYLNYDCDRTALDNVYERLITVISRISQTHVSQEAKDKAKEAQLSAESGDQQGGSGRGGSRSSMSSSASSSVTLPPALSTAALPDSGNQDLSALAISPSEGAGNEPVEVRLKRQSLECLCAVLRSLVIWSQRGSPTSEHSGPASSGAGLSHSISNGSVASGLDAGQPSSPRVSEDARYGDEIQLDGAKDGSLQHSSEASRVATPEPSTTSSRNAGAAVSAEDDPSRFQDAKQRKTILLEGIRKFNFKPKRGIDFLLQNGFLRSRQPSDIARFLLNADGLNKAQIGEYLGEGDPENIAIMHAFVDLMEFDNQSFTAALRRFLQSFRLPGESQKIDRYMLKFAERYVAGNPNAFANADTAYVLAYSVVMLNTDAHSPQVKHRMTLKDFIRNNEGIDDGKSLPEDFIKAIYDEIQTNEIKMKDEQLAAATQPAAPAAGLAGAIATVGRDLQREAYVLQSEGMASKTEALFRTMVRAQRRIHPQQRAAAEQFYSASHFEHVRPMFEVAWMAFLAGISGPMQESDDADTIARCLTAFKDAIYIVCLFGMELERNAFVTTLAKFTFLNNLGEMKSKNVEAIKTLLGIAQTSGNYLKGSWKEVLACVSQLERFQLISGGVDERQLPEIGRRASSRGANGASSGPFGSNSNRHATSLPDEQVVQAGGSTEVTIAADMVFSSSSKLSGEAIVDFVQCLAENSSEEIQSTGMTEHPRLFSLQKLVEISYYNMNRIRLEWSSIWAILGQHFNQVCVHPNTRVSAFALDSLRQLSNRFLELEELANFKFQKDFLKPFEYTMRNTKSSEAKEMVLSCLQQMILSRIHNMRSGWRALFGTLGASAKSNEVIATHAFELVRGLYDEHFNEIILAGAFADLTVCLTDFAKATQAQRIALRSVELLGSLVPAMLASPVCPLDLNNDPGPAQAHPPTDDPMVRFWFPSLFAFYDVIMNGDDLEVRRVALDSLFEILKKYGASFRPDFWGTVCQEVIFPIFAVLRSRSDVSRFSTQEDMSVWLSTTMIQALRNLIGLWTYYFETLEDLLPKLLGLLCACICQENDTLARIGTSCLQQLLENNVRKLSEAQWTEVVDTFLQLFRTTTAHQLFDPALRAEHVATSPVNETRPSVQGSSRQQDAINPLSPGPSSEEQARFPSSGVDYEHSHTAAAAASTLLTGSERRRAFKQIIVKCVLQLLLIETTHELLAKPIVYDLIPPAELLRLTEVLESSYRFSKRFNADKELRIALWKVGFMKQLPNLLKQESSAAATLINVLVRMHGDPRWSHRSTRAQVRRTLVPLGEEVVNSYLPLDPETQGRNVAAWTPVVAEVFRGICTFHDVASDEELNEDENEVRASKAGGLSAAASSVGGQVFTHHAKIFYPLAVDLLSREPLAASIGESLRTFFYKVGIAQGMIDESNDRDRRRKVQEGRDREKGLRNVSMESYATSPRVSSNSTLGESVSASVTALPSPSLDAATSKSEAAAQVMATLPPTPATEIDGAVGEALTSSTQSYAPSPPAVEEGAKSTQG